ncbi:hypothetical protein K439DRAFT_617507 [Ramaria rubella]|nr:hypothetical protein K439DRAFT_617507 [Ramaria rubella]
MSIKSSPLDWLSFPPSSPGDVHAPHPDLFELELDSSIIALPQGDQEQLQLLNIELSDPYAFVRSDTPRCGPPSSFTVSSESTYDSYSSHSESLYNYSNPDFSNDYRVELGIDFSRFSVDVDAAAAEAKVQLNAAANIKDEPDNASVLLSKVDNDPTLGSPNNVFGVPYATTDVNRRSSYQEGLTPAPAALGNAAQYPVEYFASTIFNHKSMASMQSTISPSTLIPTRVPTIANMGHTSASPTPSATNSTHSAGSAHASSPQHDMSEHRDPRKKYRCSSCPRAFARAYNLKTHLQTHDPNRLKPHTCPHRSCGRSFSRKHDLGRHLVSIHRDEPVGSTDEHKAIGVTQGTRGWCNDCGVSWVGKQPACPCHDVK